MLICVSISEQDSGLLGEQVDTMGLNVNIAWIGSHLHSFVQERTDNKLPTLFFNWMPNTLTALGNYTRVKFPLCETSQQRPTDCDFEVNQLSKVTWVRINFIKHILGYQYFKNFRYRVVLVVGLVKMCIFLDYVLLKINKYPSS